MTWVHLLWNRVTIIRLLFISKVTPETERSRKREIRMAILNGWIDFRASRTWVTFTRISLHLHQRWLKGVLSFNSNSIMFTRMSHRRLTFDLKIACIRKKILRRKRPAVQSVKRPMWKRNLEALRWRCPRNLRKSVCGTENVRRMSICTDLTQESVVNRNLRNWQKV